MDALLNLATLAENELNTIEINQAFAIKEESEARVQAVMENIADGIITFDEQGRIESFNHAAQDLFGYEASKIVGQNVDMLAPQSVQRRRERQVSHRSGSLFTLPGKRRELIGRRENGATFSMELNVNEVHLENQYLFIAIVRDITARKQAEEAQFRLASLVENSIDAIAFDLLDRGIYGKTS